MGRICLSTCKDTYRLYEKDLIRLRPLLCTNPHYESAPSMKLYSRFLIVKQSLKKHGSYEKLNYYQKMKLENRRAKRILYSPVAVIDRMTSTTTCLLTLQWKSRLKLLLPSRGLLKPLRLPTNDIYQSMTSSPPNVTPRRIALPPTPSNTQQVGKIIITMTGKKIYAAKFVEMLDFSTYKV